MASGANASLTTINDACTLGTSKPKEDTIANFAISGTYTTVTFVFEGSVDGTIWFPIASILQSTGVVQTGTITPANSATLDYKVLCEGLFVRLKLTAIASGTVAVVAESNRYQTPVSFLPITTPGASSISDAMLGSGSVTRLVAFAVNLASITGTQDVVTNFTPGFAGKIVGIDFIVNVPVTTASKLATLNVEINTTDTTGGVLALTSALATPMGKVIAGSAFAALNTFTATDTISIEASAVTAFSEGTGTIMLKLQQA